MSDRAWLVCASIVAASAPAARAAAPAGSRAPARQVLPLRNVVFYESGVGYFERRGAVQRGGALDLLVPENHLDDALTTLVVLTSDGARVGAVTFPSVLAPDAAMAEAPAPMESFVQDGPIGPLVAALAGVPAVLATKSGERLAGRMVGLGRVQETAPPDVDLQADVALSTPYPPQAPGTIQVPVAVFLTSDGALRWFHLDEIESVGPSDAQARDAMDRAVGAMAERRGEALATLGLSVDEGGDLGIGYLAEASVWRVSYRILFRDGAARLQGWALVHNDTDEDWTRIAVEFVEGNPTSYLYPFATPRFRPREVIPPPDDLQTVPQLAGTNVDQLVAGDYWGYGGLGMVGTGYGGGGGYGYGSGSGYGMIGRGGTGEEASPLIDFGASAAEPRADPEQRRELLSYRGTEPLSLRAHESALVPVIDGPVSAERISLVSPDSYGVLAALRLENTTDLSLKEGPLAVFDSGFVGQTWIPRMHAGESRMLPHGMDQDVVVDQRDTGAVEEIRVVRWNPGSRSLDEHYVHRVQTTYEIGSHASSGRTLYVRIRPLTNGRTLADQPLERLADVDGGEYDHLRIGLGAGETRTQEVVTEEGLVRSYAREQIDADLLGRLAASPTLGEPTRNTLGEALAAAEESESLAGAAESMDDDIRIAAAEADRHRLDLSALAGSSADEDIATGIAERLADVGRRIDELGTSRRRTLGESARARERALVILRTLR